ncbi:hypothetical protein LMG27177_04978 [Paraburkholderia fynbosensis]|uniref:Uncharacterized protein n=1 Tax=Paraburkholderia fynbosensis TaxID=1200993 RepID=A0A6J5GI68_9BURK|nr:hypothetical protein LMG27177_04978 [Paraburkholderia fynbosensis]
MAAQNSHRCKGEDFQGVVGIAAHGDVSQVYESAIQTALKKVSNALTARATYVDQVQADRDYVASAQRYCTLAEARYKAGTDSFLPLSTRNARCLPRNSSLRRIACRGRRIL